MNESSRPRSQSSTHGVSSSLRTLQPATRRLLFAARRISASFRPHSFWAATRPGQYSEWYWIKEKPVVSQTSQGWFRVRQDWVGIEHPTPDDIKVSRGPII